MHLDAIEPAVERWQRREVVRRIADHRIAIGPHFEGDETERGSDDARLDPQRNRRRRLVADVELIHLLRPVAAGQPAYPWPHDDVERVGDAGRGGEIEEEKGIVDSLRRGVDRAGELDRHALADRVLRECRRRHRHRPAQHERDAASPSADPEPRRGRAAPPATGTSRGAAAAQRLHVVVPGRQLDRRHRAASACTTSASNCVPAHRHSSRRASAAPRAGR